MSTTFISRGKAMLGAAIATIALAFGMAALAPANAQAIDIDDSSADYVDIPVGKSNIWYDGDPYKIVFSWVPNNSSDPEDESIGESRLTLWVDDQPGYVIYSSFAFDSQEKADDAYMMKNLSVRLMTIDGSKFWRFINSNNGWVHFEANLHRLWSDNEFLPDDCEYGANRLPYAMKITEDSVIYTFHRADYMFKSGYRDFKYKYTFKYNDDIAGKLFLTTSKYSVPTSTTKWRTLAKTKTAYKSSTSTKKKFSCAKGSKVQVKKIYWNKSTGKLRYYVKNKKGKYGWIAGTTYTVGA